MSEFLEIVGGLTISALGILVGIVALFIAGNLYGGIKGAYRLRAITIRAGKEAPSHRSTIKYGLRAWYGKRYENGIGEYWQIGGMEVPVDGRDKIRRNRFYGA